MALIPSFLFVLIQFFAVFHELPKVGGEVPNKDFQVLGYVLNRGDWSKVADKIDFTQVSDLNLAFINPDENGNFKTSLGLESIVNKAKEHGVKIYISIGGGNPPEHLGSFLEPEKRDRFISALVSLAKEYDFDGVDVDLENDLINEHYADFIREFSVELKANNKKMTAALASWNADRISDETLMAFDNINVMSYDQTGPWNLDKPGQHSPYEMVENDFIYFHQERGIPADRLLMGLPFYGYGFGEGAPESMTYRDIVANFPGAENKNVIDFPEGGSLYYNGKDLISKKVGFAIQKGAAGVMIWQLFGDSDSPHSLISVINQTILDYEKNSSF